MRWALFALNSYIKNMWFNGMFLLFEVITTIFGVKMTIFWFKAGLSILGLSSIYLLPLFAPHFWHLHLFDNKLFVSLAAWSSFALEMKQMHHVRKKCAASLLPWFQYFQLLLLSEWWASQRARGRCARGSWSLHIHTWQTVRGTNRKQQSTEEPMRRCKTRYIPGFVAYRQIIIRLSTNIKVRFFGSDFPCLKKQSWYLLGHRIFMCIWNLEALAWNDLGTSLFQLVDAEDRFQESHFTEAQNIYISRQRIQIGDVCGCDRLK